MFVKVGHLPDQATGEIVEVIFHHSMLENNEALTHPILTYIAQKVSIIFAVINAIVLKVLNSKAIKNTANVAFGVTIGLFFILLLLASTVTRGY